MQDIMNKLLQFFLFVSAVINYIKHVGLYIWQKQQLFGDETIVAKNSIKVAYCFLRSIKLEKTRKKRVWGWKTVWFKG